MSNYTFKFSQGGPQVTPTQQTKCRIWWDESVQGYHVSTPYSKEFVEFIKLGVPASDRGFDPTTKIWTVTEKYFDLIYSTATKVWKNPGDVAVVTKAQSQAASAPPAVSRASLDSVMLDFVKMLPERALLQAFRFAAAELHPDKGGDMDKMMRLNTLWDRIKTDKGLK